jgi:hypothetical protein
MIGDDAIAMVKLGPGLVVPIDRLTPELRRRWDQAQCRRANGEDMSRTIRAIVDEAKATLGAELVLRAAHRAGPRTALAIGLAEDV